MLNINNSDDINYRYKMPALSIKLGGAGNGIFTIINNILIPDTIKDNSNNVLTFKEKPKGDGNWINGGFFVCEPDVLRYISGDEEIFENSPLETLTNENKVIAYKHKGFWKCMDTLRDKTILNELWNNNNAKWKTW